MERIGKRWNLPLILVKVFSAIILSVIVSFKLLSGIRRLESSVYIAKGALLFILEWQIKKAEDKLLVSVKYQELR